MTTMDTTSNNVELMGTLKLSNMIPVPDSELTPYNIKNENDNKYRQLLEKEYAFIYSNSKMILKNAKIIYQQKLSQHSLTNKLDAPNLFKKYS